MGPMMSPRRPLRIGIEVTPALVRAVVMRGAGPQDLPGSSRASTEGCQPHGCRDGDKGRLGNTHPLLQEDDEAHGHDGD